jgi:N-terminal domain of molybdenum-binding protein
MRGDAAVEAQLSVGDAQVTTGDIHLLSAVGSHGSLHQAAEALGRSYAHAHRRVVTLEGALGPLVERRRGGAGGGGSELTQPAVMLIRQFRLLEQTLRWVAAGESTIVEGTLTAHEGELATVQTAAGAITAVVPTGTGVIDLHIRAEAVALVEGGVDAESTSIMNRFEGAITTIDRGEQIDRVAVDVGLEVPLRALITRASTDRMRLTPGEMIGVQFKATAVRGLPREHRQDTPDGQ